MNKISEILSSGHVHSVRETVGEQINMQHVQQWNLQRKRAGWRNRSGMQGMISVKGQEEASSRWCHLSQGLKEVR